MISLSDINKLKNQANAVHMKVAQIVDLKKVSGERLREYQNKTEQYSNMVQSLDMMLELSTTDEARENILHNQVVDLETWIRFELEFAKKL